MKPDSSETKDRYENLVTELLIGLALAAGCMLVGATIPTTNQAHGEVRGSAGAADVSSRLGAGAAGNLGNAPSNGRAAGTAGNGGAKAAAKAAISAQRAASTSTLTSNELDRERLESRCQVSGVRCRKTTPDTDTEGAIRLRFRSDTAGSASMWGRTR